MAAVKTRYKFGAFKGVFTPSLLTILGVIMFLRFGWVLGNVGLASTLIIVTVSSLITFLTGLSVSALATNMRIKTGGAYYIISRSLGVETGAAIGLWLYLAQAIGIAFYVTGFAESIALFYPGVLEVVSQKTIGLAVLAVLGVVTLKSADLALKAQFVILGCIVLSLASLFLGHPPDLPPIGPSQVPVERQSFWVVFAVFFPAVTGILSGIGISGDLKDPSRALPLGTLGAVGISYLVYMIIPVFLVHTVPDLRQIVLHPLIFKISRAGPF